jgi:hypothetical protein
MSTVMDKTKALIGYLLRDVHSSNDKLAKAEAPGLAIIKITSDTFQTGMAIPKRCSQEGQSISPQLSWTGVPSETRELVLVCEDPDAPSAHPIVHWVAYNISPTVTSLPEGVAPSVELPNGGRQAKNYTGKFGYLGPMPPLGHGLHHYHFQLFALDGPLSFAEPPDRNALVAAMRHKVIAEGELVGTYERNA